MQRPSPNHGTQRLPNDDDDDDDDDDPEISPSSLSAGCHLQISLLCQNDHLTALWRVMSFVLVLP